jgi:hypothetical protein
VFNVCLLNLDLEDRFQSISLSGQDSWPHHQSYHYQKRRVKVHQPEYYTRKQNKRNERARVRNAGETLHRELGSPVFEELGELLPVVNKWRDESPNLPAAVVARELLRSRRYTLFGDAGISEDLNEVAVIYLITESDTLRFAEEDDERWGDVMY